MACPRRACVTADQRPFPPLRVTCKYVWHVIGLLAYEISLRQTMEKFAAIASLCTRAGYAEMRVDGERECTADNPMVGNLFWRRQIRNSYIAALKYSLARSILFFRYSRFTCSNRFLERSRFLSFANSGYIVEQRLTQAAHFVQRA